MLLKRRSQKCKKQAQAGIVIPPQRGQARNGSWVDTTNDGIMKIGLCESCRNAEITANRRGSRFYLCKLSAGDARFPKYPRLPVLACEGYDPRPGQEVSPGPGTPKK